MAGPGGPLPLRNEERVAIWCVWMELDDVDLTHFTAAPALRAADRAEPLPVPANAKAGVALALPCRSPDGRHGRTRGLTGSPRTATSAG